MLTSEVPATRRLASQRIEVINDAKVEEVGSDAVAISDGRTIPTRTTAWTAGLEPPPLVGNLEVQKTLAEGSSSTSTCG